MDAIALAFIALLILIALGMVCALSVQAFRARPYEARPPWPMPGGPARPLWREQWDPRVPFPSDVIAEQWDQQEARDVAHRLRAQALIAQSRGSNWFGT
jgi:hypothetical protein